MIDLENLSLPLEATAIREILPHRSPFLMIDRVIELEPRKRIKAIKAISQNEWFFQGHFPEQPVMPGVLQIEALAQAGGIIVLTIPENRGRIAFMTGVHNCKFRRRVLPGDLLTLEVELNRYRTGYGKAHGIASVDGEVTLEGDVNFAIVAP